MSDWQEARLGDLLRIKHGFAFKSAHFSDAPGAIVLTPGNFEPEGGLKLRPEKDRSYTGDFPAEFKLNAGDLLVVMTDLTQTAAILGAPAVVPEGVQALHNQRLGKVVELQSDRIDRRFLYYVFNSVEYREWLKSTATGSTVRHTSPSRIYEHKFRLPPLKTQRRIAAILGAYDDLIEVNRRRVAVLEEMARALFEEWFVRFRFPGHEQVPLLDTPNGPLPQGWERSQLKNVAVLKSGYAFKSSTFVEEGSYSLVTIKHVHDGVLLPPFQSKIDQLPHNMPSHCHIFTGDMLVSLTGNVGRTCLAWGKNLLLNQRVAKIVANREDLQAFAYVWFRQPHTLKRLQQISNGAAQQNLSPIQTMELPIIIPPFELTEAYQKFAGPILKSCLLCHMTGAILEQQRDLLLPRLISGQLSVEAAERQLEDAA